MTGKKKRRLFIIKIHVLNEKEVIDAFIQGDIQPLH